MMSTALRGKKRKTDLELITILPEMLSKDLHYLHISHNEACDLHQVLSSNKYGKIILVLLMALIIAHSVRFASELLIIAVILPGLKEIVQLKKKKKKSCHYLFTLKLLEISFSFFLSNKILQTEKTLSCIFQIKKINSDYQDCHSKRNVKQDQDKSTKLLRKL